MKKVLILTYYWPPAGGIAVQRITKFCKYLTDFGWKPVILTVKKGNYVSQDNSFIKDIEHITHIYKTPSIEPHAVYELLRHLPGINRKAGQTSVTPNPSRFSIFSEFIRLNFFIPDSRIGWKPFAVHEGKQIIDDLKPSLIFSTAPPFTPHLIAMSLHQSSGIPWVADFRDPWVHAACYNTVNRFNIVKSFNRYLQTKVVNNATALTFTGPQLRDHYVTESSQSIKNKTHVITNGYDPDDILNNKPQQSQYFYISYYGSIYIRRYRNILFSTIGNLLRSNKELAKDLRLRMVGNIDNEIRYKLTKVIPDNNLELHGFISYKTVIEWLQQEQVLLLIVDDVPFNENITLGKVFDYLPTGNPILGLGPTNGDTALIVHSANAGEIFEYNDSASIEKYIINQYENWKNNRLQKRQLELDNYQRKYLTEKLALVFDSLISE